MLNLGKTRVWWKYTTETPTKVRKELRGNRIITTVTIKRITACCWRNEEGDYREVKATCNPEDSFTKGQGRVVSLNKLIALPDFSFEEKKAIFDAFMKSNIIDKCLDCLDPVEPTHTSVEA